MAPADAGQLRVEVRDTGIGIAAGDLPQLFTEFVQLDGGSTKKQKGTGLGLALAKRLAEAQGGSVGVRSRPGKGSVFHALLPRVEVVEAPPSGTPDREAGTGPGRRARRTRQEVGSSGG